MNLSKHIHNQFSMMKLPALFVLFFFIASGFSARAQDFMIRGRIIDAVDSTPVIGATLIAYQTVDSTNKKFAETDTAGRFKIAGLDKGKYIIRISYMGYKALYVKAEIEDKNIFLGTLKLSNTNLKEVKIYGRQTVAEQKGDTVEYNANAFKTNPDANAEDLVTKMPGITMNNGTLQAHGEDVKKVLVDGKPFFGDDPTAALRNLPSDIVDKVQVYDKLSDQSQFTGFDDGNSQKTINITTKKNKQNGQFGKVVAGYGTDGRYTGSEVLNLFKGNQRISIIGMSNNLNQQNFATQDLLGVTGGGGGFGHGGRMGGAGRPSGNWMPNNPSISNFLVGQQGGNTTTNSAGLNYGDSIGRKVYLSGSYFFNNTNNITNSALARSYFTTRNISPLYNEADYNSSSNYNHRANLRLEYLADSANTLILTPKFSYQANNASSDMTGINRLSAFDTTSRTDNRYLSNSSGYDFNANLLWQHKFAKKGRTLSLNIGADISPKTASDTLHSINRYYGPPDSVVNINQQSSSPSKSYSYNANIAYTEPISKFAQLMFNYSPSYTKNSLDKRTLSRNGPAGEYNILDSSLSNSYSYTTLTNNAGLSVRMRIKTINLSAGVNVQNTKLDGDQVFPTSATVHHPFNSILPNAMFSEKFENKTNLRIMYRTSTSLPSIQQLQSVINNTNPLILSSGNPDLSQSYSHSLIMHYGKTDTKKAHSFFVFAMVSTTNQYIGNSSIIAFRDSILPGGFKLAKGSQFSQPVNLDNYWSARTFATYGLPLDFIKSNLNLNAGVSYSSTPGLVNNQLNYANTYALSPSVVISSNISEKLDYTISYYGSYNIVNNTLNTQSNNNYFTGTAALKFNWIFWKGFTLSADISHNLYNGLSSQYNQSLLLVNGGIGKRLFKEQNGEIKLYVFDLLNQNTSISRTVTDTYIDDLRTQVLQRYFMVQFTYNLKHFVKS
jgi:hypothetical protein